MQAFSEYKSEVEEDAQRFPKIDKEVLISAVYLWLMLSDPMYDILCV